MRILHIGKFFPPAPGGIETYLGDLCAGLAAEGVGCRVLCHRGHESEPEFRETGAGVVVERVPVAATVCYSQISPAFPLRLRRAVREFSPSLIHVHMPNLSGFSALQPGLGVPLVVHWHSDVAWPAEKRLARGLYRMYAPLEASLLRRARAVVATSGRYLEGSPVLGRFRDKCRVVPLGVRGGRLKVPAADEAAAVRERWLGTGGRDSCLVLCAGRFAHYKGLEFLVRAMAEVPRATLVMVGDGETRSRIESLVRSSGLGERVRLAGRLPDAGLHALMAACDVFCLPSVERSEAFGMVLVEAMALGACCVSTDIPGSAPGWVVRNGETGLVVPPGDAEALARVLRRLAGDPELRRRMGEAGAARYGEHFRLRATLPPLLDVYAEALGR